MDKEQVLQKLRDRVSKTLTESLKLAEQNLDLMPKLKENGIPFSFSENYPESVTINLGNKNEDTVGKLNVLRKIFGHKLYLNTKSVEDANNNTVSVCLKCEGYPRVYIYYVEQLKENSKCRIEQGDTNYVLVCQS